VVKRSLQPIHVIHVSDVHLGSGESHGRLNPQTGLNVRFEDFVAAFGKSVTYAIDQSADIFLFSGDAYRNAAPDPLYQKAFAAELRRLSEAGIKTILLVGNHDQILRSTSTHSMSVFQSLAVPNVITIDQPQLLKVDTANGACQIIGIPHVTRHFLMAHEKYANYSGPDIDKVIVAHVRELLADFYEQLDPTLPSIVTAHMMVDRARAGSEQELVVGYSMTFPTDIFVDPRVDYVALGHVHGHQVLRQEAPAIVYSGSIERVDFGEEHEDKGFVHVKLRRGAASFEFHSINPRPFITVDADLTSVEEPTAKLAAAIADKVLPGCVLRARFQLRADQADQLDEQQLRAAAACALSLQLKPQIVTEQREFRMPEITESSVHAPLLALDRYLEQIAPERKDELMQRARDLCSTLDSFDEPQT
jgi:exonuclease SbcD